nr:CMGC/CLK protein kinase [Cryptococcus depauperatus CBS 7841]
MSHLQHPAPPIISLRHNHLNRNRNAYDDSTTSRAPILPLPCDDRQARIPSIIVPPSPYVLHQAQLPTVSPQEYAYPAGVSQGQPRPPHLAGISGGQHSPRSPYGQLHTFSWSNPLSAASSTSSNLGERVLRSPHPPLTALYPSQQQHWPHPLPPVDVLNRSFPAPVTYRALSPFRIPAPLRFRYSQSPEMPPRKKVDATPSTRTSSTSVASTRTRRNVNGKGYMTEHTLDPSGQRKEVIIIDDSASPMVQPVRKRTRAQVAAEQAAQQMQLYHAGYTNSAVLNGGVSAVNAGSAKKRKLDEDHGKKVTKQKLSTATSGSVQTTATWQSSQQLPPVKPVQYQKAPSQPTKPVWDDDDGHYIVKPDDIIANKYKIVRLLGQGTFGKVVEARHIETRRKVAIKVIRAVQKYREASKIEIRVLEALKKHDPKNDNKCIHLDEYFDFRNHPCLVSELYGMSVFDFLKQNSFQPFPDRHIQDFAKSLLKSVAYLHSLKLVHTDLKPENILLCSNEARLVGPRVRNARSKSILRNTEIRLIDFGSATFESEYHSSVVSTRHYRAPEIILGLPWSYPCDMFSIGCILVEFFTGNALFQTHDNLEHLAMMEVVMGKFSTRMIEKGRAKKPEYFKGNKIDFPNSTTPKGSKKYVKQMLSLKQVIDPANRHQQLFLDLCTRLLEHDPDIRIKVQDALRHPYLTEPISDPA